MYDFHSHILPDIDDGSRSVTESLEMLRQSARQGVTHLVATPHFYADRTSPDEFLERRRLSWDQLAPHLEESMPQITLGAEVHYYEGIFRLNNIPSLCMEGTGLLLVEMPFSTWSRRVVDALLELNDKEGIQVLLAHMERYLKDQPKAIWNTLYDAGILMQANSEFFLDWRTRRTALKMLKNNKIQFLGSDCHNIRTRRPNLGITAGIIENRLGGDVLAELNLRGREALHEGE